MNGICLLYTLVSSRQEAVLLAQSALKAHLAICVNIFPCQSLYMWQGNLQNSPEEALIFKTVARQLEPLKELIIELHPYEVPALLQLEVPWALPSFGQWARATLVKNDQPLQDFENR